jgi:hypothetical protein
MIDCIWAVITRLSRSRPQSCFAGVHADHSRLSCLVVQSLGGDGGGQVEGTRGGGSGAGGRRGRTPSELGAVHSLCQSHSFAFCLSAVYAAVHSSFSLQVDAKEAELSAAAAEMRSLAARLSAADSELLRQKVARGQRRGDGRAKVAATREGRCTSAMEGKGSWGDCSGDGRAAAAAAGCARMRR